MINKRIKVVNSYLYIVSVHRFMSGDFCHEKHDDYSQFCKHVKK